MKISEPLKVRIAAAFCVFALASFATPNRVLDVRFRPVAENVYAYVGDIGPRTAENEGLNANIGLVVTPDGAVLIDSGSTSRVAAAINSAVRQVTSQRVRWVINTGGQDHRWLGNGYFHAKGAELIAHTSAIADMLSRGGDQLTALRALLRERAAETEAVMPTSLVRGPRETRSFGGVSFEFRHVGGGHTPGDMMVWLPSHKVLFAGDIVYVDRLPAILPVSSTRAWLDAFAVIEELAPRRIVPGHGEVTSLERARAHTRDYLMALRSHMKRTIQDRIEIDAAVQAFDHKPYRHLANAAELGAANANHVYLEVERE